jgi:alginate O-acetyltransferase complex protein AlgI
LLGFHFMVNFRQPYLAVGLQDFWRRWHISLSTWLRDYLYIPLGGNRGGEAKTYRNLLLTMLLGGLWHGANWTYVVWGALQGLGLSFERFVFGHREQHTAPRGWLKWARCMITFQIVCFAWIFFRAESVSAALAMIKQLSHFRWVPDYAAAWLFLALLGGAGLLIDLQLEVSGNEYLFQKESWQLRYAAAVAAMVLLILFAASEPHAFIYFQF